MSTWSFRTGACAPAITSARSSTPDAVVHLIGERPGTGLDTLSAYLTYGRDAAGRSRWSPDLDHAATTAVCGIHREGKPPSEAVGEIARLVRADPRHAAVGCGAVTNDDARELNALGYAQELFRTMGGFSNFAISFSIISILTGAVTLYSHGLVMGGPAEMAFGWPLVSVFTLDGRAEHGGARLVDADLGRDVSLGVPARRQRLGLVYRVVQHHRAARDAGGHRLRLRALRDAAHRPADDARATC